VDIRTVMLVDLDCARARSPLFALPMRLACNLSSPRRLKAYERGGPTPGVE